MGNVWDKEPTFLEELLYRPESLWVGIESKNEFRIGVSDLGVRVVKGLSYVTIESPVGKQVKKGDIIGIVATS